MSKPNIIQVIKSVLAAAIGVQSDANRKQDFSHGSLGIYVVVGLIAVVIFILALTTLVSFIL